MQTSSDGFTLVTRKSRHKKNAAARFASGYASVECYNDPLAEASREPHLDEIEDTFARCMSNLRQSNAFLEEVLTKSRQLVRAASRIKIDEEPAVDIVSYGIGHFATTAASMYQLCLLVELNRNLNARSCVVADPIFTETERKFIDSRGLLAARVNDRGLCKVQPCDAVLYGYMPHCGKPLYNNLLYANWTKEALERVVIFGNTFASMIQQEDELTELHYVQRALKLAEHQYVENEFLRCERAFNDTSIMRFRTDLTQEDDEEMKEFWQRGEKEPVYRLTANQMIGAKSNP